MQSKDKQIRWWFNWYIDACHSGYAKIFQHYVDMCVLCFKTEADICRELGIELIEGLGNKIQSSSWLLDKE